MRTIRAIPLLLALLAASQAAAQILGTNVSKSGTAVATMLEIPVGASAIGMGGAFVSLPNDATSLYWNPAGAARLLTNEAALVHTNWIADTRFDFAALVLPLSGFGSLGLSITTLSMDDMKVRTVELPEGTGEYFSAGDIVVGLSYARALTDRFAIGFTAKYIQQRIWHETASALAVDVGTVFRTDLFGHLTLGAALSNFGTSMRLDGRDTRTFSRVDPTKLGSNERVAFNTELDSWDLPLLFRFGISSTPMESDEFRWTVAADALHPSDEYESVNIGTELAFREALFLRGGFQSLFLKEREGGVCLGVGLSSALFFAENTRVQFDYAYRNMGRLETIHTLTVGVRF